LGTVSAPNVPVAFCCIYKSELTTPVSRVQAYIVIVAASIPFLRPLFRGKKIFTWAYYRSLLARYSHRSRSKSGDSGQTGDTLYEEKGGAKALESLPHVPKDRFVTTTLRNAGMESDFDRMSTLEAGQVYSSKG
jgi:hypothetical protein